MKYVTIALASLLCATSAMAGDHLIPETNGITGETKDPRYDNGLEYLFREAFDIGVVARVVVEPSFSPEYAVALKDEGKTYRVMVLTLEKPLSETLPPYYIDLPASDTHRQGNVEKIGKDFSKNADAQKFERETGLPASVRNLKVDKCSAEIGKPEGNKIARVWKEMLLDTRFERDNETGVMGADGEVFHFSAFGEKQFLAGWVWQSRGPKTLGLEKLASAMTDYCGKKDQALLTKLDSQVDDLLKQLN